MSTVTLRASGWRANRVAAHDRRSDDTVPAPKPFSLTPGAADARRALAVALACIESAKRGTPVAVNAVAVNTLAVHETAVL